MKAKEAARKAANRKLGQSCDPDFKRRRRHERLHIVNRVDYVILILQSHQRVFSSFKTMSYNNRETYTNKRLNEYHAVSKYCTEVIFLLSGIRMI